MGARLRLLLLAVLTVVAAVLGTRAGRHADRPGGSEGETVAPVDRPADVVAEVVLATPDATWRKVQLAVAGAMVLAPATFGGLLAYRAGLPELAAVIDGGAPAYGVVDATGAWVVAARVGNLARARDLRVGEHAVMFADAGSSTWALVGSDSAAVSRLGPYTYKNLPRGALPPSALVVSLDHPALAGLHTVLDRKLADLDAFLRRTASEQQAAHDGRAPDLADTQPFSAAILSLGHRYADAVCGMERVEAAFDVDDAGIGLRTKLVPPASGPSKDWAAGLASGPPSELEGSSSTSVATVFWRSTEAERKEAAASVAGAMPQALAGRVPAADIAPLAPLLAEAATARGDWTLASVESSSAAGVVLRLGARDPQALAGTVEGVVDALRRPGWASWERSALTVTRVERKGSRATFTTEQASVQMTWSAGAKGDELDVAGGFDPAATLERAFPARGLATDLAVAPWLHALGPSVVWAAVARPLMLGGALRMDPLLVALVRAGSELELRAHVTGPIVRQLITGLM